MAMTVKFSKISHKAQEFAQAITDAAHQLGLGISDEQVVAILRYLDGLLLWGKAYNLTAITDPDEALIKHIFDCMAIVPDLPLLDTASSVRLLDIGTGAGLPSVIIAILCPHWQVDALDSNQKKIRFIRQIASEIGLKNIQPVAARIEHHQQDKPKAYQIITSRAFASLEDFVQLAQPCLADGGWLYAMKGKDPTQKELDDLPSWHIQIKKIQVPKLGDDRCVVYLKQPA